MLIFSAISIFIVSSELSYYHLYAAKNNKGSSYKMQQAIYQGKFYWPPELDFRFRKSSRDSNKLAAQPFVFDGPIVLDQRYISAYYNEIFVIHMTTYKYYQPHKMLTDENLKKYKLTLLESRNKRRGELGREKDAKLYKFIQAFDGVKYVKWVSTFATKGQTDVFIALYPEKYESTFISDMLLNLLDTAELSNKPL